MCPGIATPLSGRQLGTVPSFILGEIIATYSLQKLLCIALTCRSGSMACTVAMRPDQLDRETESSRSCQKSYIDFITLYICSHHCVKPVKSSLRTEFTYFCMYVVIIMSNQ